MPKPSVFAYFKGMKRFSSYHRPVMKKYASLCGFLLPLVLMGLPVHTQAQDWQLVWADEFEGTEVDTTKWSFQIGDGCPDLCGWGNGEEQYYTAENATVEGGMLRITAEQDSVGGRAYTSARLRTKGKADWTYGRFETRAKLTRTTGFWPAIWMLPSDEAYGGWAASGEIDILEIFGNASGTVHGTIHFGGASPQNTSSGGSWTLPFRNFSTSFHDFAIEWVPGEIRWYVDGNLYHTENEWYTTEARFPAPFDQSFHLLVNLAIGGAAGTPNASSRFPQSMEVDYIRVYQAMNVDPVVQLDAPADGATVTPGSDVVLRATATDTDGLISRVVFMAGDVELAVDDAAPYEVTVGSVAEGCYAVRAKAIDNLGGEAWSTTSQITVGSCAQAPYAMMPVALPGVIEAEHFDLGGEGVAYHDTDALNAGNDVGNDFRVDEAVDIDYALGSQQGYFVRAFEAGEWLEYQVDVSVAGAYNIDLRARSEAGAKASLIAKGAEVVSGAEIPAASRDGFTTVRTPNVTLEAGVQTFRVEANEGTLWLDHIALTAYVEPPAEGTFVIESFADGTGAAWNYFGGAEGTVTNDGDADAFMRATFSGSGGTGAGFYGVMWNNLPDTEQAVLLADPWFSMRVRHSSTGTTVDQYALEVTLREDTNGNGWTADQEDSHRLDLIFDRTAFNDEWMFISAPLSSFTDLETGGNGILEGALDEVVFVVAQVVGADPSAVEIDIDDVVLSAGPLSTGVASNVPQTLTLSQPYPNPTSGFAHFSYELDEPGPASVYLYDVLGRQVHHTPVGFQAVGRHSFRLDLSDVSSGVYFVRLEAAGRVQTRRVIVAR